MGHLIIKVAEYAIIMNSKDEFIILQFPEHKLNSKWHFPGGRLDNTDESVDGLRREIKEETNLEVTDIKPVFTKRMDPESPKYAVFFLAKAKEPYKVKISDEHVAFKWIKKGDIDNIDFWQPFYKEMLEKVLQPLASC